MSEEMGRHGDLDSPERRIAEKLVDSVMQSALGEFSDRIKEISDQIYSHINDAVVKHLAGDTEMNFIDSVRHRSNKIIDQMLNGNAKLAEEYLLHWENKKFREDMYLVHKESIHNKIIEDLKKDRDFYKERFEYLNKRDY